MKFSGQFYFCPTQRVLICGGCPTFSFLEGLPAVAGGSCKVARPMNSTQEKLSHHQTAAITSISTNASLGNLTTCTVDLAGGAAVKYVAYTAFMAAKSFMSFRKTVVFTT